MRSGNWRQPASRVVEQKSLSRPATFAPLYHATNQTANLFRWPVRSLAFAILLGAGISARRLPEILFLPPRDFPFPSCLLFPTVRRFLAFPVGASRGQARSFANRG